MVTIEDIREAAQRIAPYIHRTPVMSSHLLNEMLGAELYFKCENMQKAGAFKGRGATNTVRQLTDEEVTRGVATHSSGNHAGALSWAAQKRGVKCTVVMPDDAPKVKIAAAKGYGADVVFCENTPQAREAELERIVKETGAVVIHPYDNDRIIAGQGTSALELLEDYPNLDVIIAPVGGGGLISGIAATVRGQEAEGRTTSGQRQTTNDGMRVIAAEPELADDAWRSMQSGKVEPPSSPKTIADGLRAGICQRTFDYMREHDVEVVTCSEKSITEAQNLIMSRVKTVVEPSGAVPFAVVLENAEQFKGKKVGIVISGGNMDAASTT